MLSTISKKLEHFLAIPTSIKVLHLQQKGHVNLQFWWLVMMLYFFVFEVWSVRLFHKYSSLDPIPELLNQNQTFNKIAGLRTTVMATVAMLDSESSFLFLIFICNYTWHSIDSLFYSCIYATIF